MKKANGIVAASRRRGQSREAQELRLKRGACPVHGLYMTQVGCWRRYREERTMVSCPRVDCGIAAASRGPDDELGFADRLSPRVASNWALTRRALN
jgi:hypothetical protein